MLLSNAGAKCVSRQDNPDQTRLRKKEIWNGVLDISRRHPQFPPPPHPTPNPSCCCFSGQFQMDHEGRMEYKKKVLGYPAKSWWHLLFSLLEKSLFLNLLLDDDEQNIKKNVDATAASPLPYFFGLRTFEIASNILSSLSPLLPYSPSRPL